MTPEQRSRNMAAIKGKDTKLEMIVRKYLFSKGLRYRVNNRKLPGSPDIVLRKYKTVIYVAGCFWHGHKDCKYFRLPTSNVDFWRIRYAMNIARDYANNIDFKPAGWKVIRIWECVIKTKTKREEALNHLYTCMTELQNVKIYHTTKIYETPMAAEPQEIYRVN